MASYGAKSPVWAPITAEGAGVAPTYGGGMILAKLVSCGVTPNAAEGSLYADNGLAEYARELTDEDLALETDDLYLDKAAALFGATIVGNDLSYRNGDNPPLGGYGFYHTAMRNGVKCHIGHFFPKVRASRNARTFTTKNNSITFGTAAIALKAMYDNSGEIERESEAFSSEESAYAWVANLLGLGSWYCVNVMVQGEGTGKSVAQHGKIFLPAGEDYTLSITGYASVLAAYDNGTDVKTDITGGSGTYTLEDLAADHEIFIKF